MCLGEAILSGEIPFIPPPDSDIHDKSDTAGTGGSILDAGLDKATSLLAQANSMLAQTSDRRTPTPTLPNLAPTPPSSSPQQNTTGTQSILANNASGQIILPKGKEPIRILPAVSLSNNPVSVTSATGSITITGKQAIQTQQKTWNLTNTTINTSKSLELQPKVLKIERTSSQSTVRTMTTVTSVTSVTTTTPSASVTSGVTTGVTAGVTAGDVSPSPVIDTKILILPPGIAQPPTPVKDNKPIIQSAANIGRRTEPSSQYDVKQTEDSKKVSC